MRHTHLYAVLLIPLLIIGTVFAADAVNTYPSGIFRGSLRHIVDLGALSEGGVMVSSVNAGDFIAFRKPGQSYNREQDHEPGEFYVRLFDRVGDGVVKYDFDTAKYQSLAFEDVLLLDVDFDGNDDVALQFSGIDLRAGSFMISLPARENEHEETEIENRTQTTSTEPACAVACFSNDDCSVDEQCVRAGTCGARCEGSFENEGGSSAPPPVYVEPEKKQSLLVRFVSWLNSLFS